MFTERTVLKGAEEMRMEEMEGRKVSLEILDKDLLDKENKFLPSEVLRVVEERVFEVAMPVIKGSYYYIPKGISLNIYFEESGEKTGSFMLYQATVEDAKKEGQFPCFLIKINGVGKKTQRRNFYRLSNTGLLDDIVINGDKDDVRFAIIDISASGAKLTSNKDARKGQIIKFNISLESGESVIVKGKVLRVQKSNEKYKSHKYELAIEFCDVLLYQEDVLVKYIASKQRKELYLTNK